MELGAVAAGVKPVTRSNQSFENDWLAAKAAADVVDTEASAGVLDCNPSP